MLDAKVTFLRETYTFDDINELVQFLRSWYATHSQRHVKVLIMLNNFGGIAR